MTYKIVFKYQPEGRLKPHATSQDQELIFKNGEYVPIPNLGDSVSYSLDNRRRSFKVLTRHFSYRLDAAGDDLCVINIVVADISQAEVVKWKN